jgi:hypothetical protein
MVLSFLLAFRLGRNALTTVFLASELSKRGPTRISPRQWRFRFPSRAQLTRFGIKTRTIRAANGLERQCKHYRVSERRFKIHVIAVNLILIGLRSSVREKLNKFDLKPRTHFSEATNALGMDLRADIDGGQNTLVYRLQSNLKLHLLARGNNRDGLPQPRGDSELVFAFAHLTSATT